MYLSWWYFNAAIYSLQPLAWINAGKDRVIMNQKSRNIPEMLWMETFFCQTFLETGLPRSWSCPHHPLLSLHRLLDFSLALPTHPWKPSQDAVSSKSLPGPLQWRLGGPLIYSLWTLASLLQIPPHTSVSSPRTGVSLDRTWHRYSIHRSTFPFIR